MAQTEGIAVAQDFIVGQGILWAEQDKDAVREYRFDLAGVLPAADPLAGVTWAVSPAGAGAPVVSAAGVSGSKATIRLSGGAVKTWYAVTGTWATAGGLTDQFVLRLFIKEDAEALASLGSALFPNRFTATARMRADRLVLLGQQLGLGGGAGFSDDYLWEKLQAAEAQVAHDLRVFLAPTRLFPEPPTEAQIAALAGQRWAVDPAYDYEPDFFRDERWGYIVTRQKPIIAIERIRFVYPTPNIGLFEVPQDWIRLDRRYGHIRFVPASSSTIMPMGVFALQAFGGGRTLPFAIQVDYTAGLENAARDYPDLVDLVYRVAALRIVGDAMVPQSGSISADGLSQSMSIDMAKYHEEVDLLLNGPKGSNGGLMTAIHGVRGTVLGG